MAGVGRGAQGGRSGQWRMLIWVKRIRCRWHRGKERSDTFHPPLLPTPPVLPIRAVDRKVRKNHFPLKLPLPSIAESLQARWVCQADSKLLPSWTLRISPPPKGFTWSFFFEAKSPIMSGEPSCPDHCLSPGHSSAPGLQS